MEWDSICMMDNRSYDASDDKGEAEKGRKKKEKLQNLTEK